MKKFLSLLPALALAVPFAAGAVYIDTGLDARAGAGQSGASAGVDARIEVSGKGSANAQKPADHEQEARIEAEADALGEVHTTLRTPSGAEMDFASHIETVRAEHANVKAADIDHDGTVEVRYQHAGKLLGFLPVTLVSKTRVHAAEEGGAKVVVEMPWWSFLVTGAEKARADIEAALNASAAVQVNASAEAAAHSSARLADAIVASLDAFAEFEAETAASVSGGTYLEGESPQNAGAAE